MSKIVNAETQQVSAGLAEARQALWEAVDLRKDISSQRRWRALVMMMMMRRNVLMSCLYKI